MALGSSAPEILLGIGEVAGRGFQAGALGPGTIVGSAAFNMLMILAICVTIKEGKRVKHLNVLLCTFFFSIWAYVCCAHTVIVLAFGARAVRIACWRQRLARAVRVIISSCLYGLLACITRLIPAQKVKLQHPVRNSYISRALHRQWRCRYIWLYLIVKQITPNVIDVWEAVVTILHFPLFLVVSWLFDIGVLSKGAVAKKVGNLRRAISAKSTRRDEEMAMEVSAARFL